jgi:hypothetical protein
MVIREITFLILLKKLGELKRKIFLRVFVRMKKRGVIKKNTLMI